MGAQQNLYEIGAEYEDVIYDGFWDWFIKVTPLEHHLKYQPSYLLSQFAFIFGGIVTLIHAWVRGGRFPYLWYGIIIHGLITESISYLAPDVDNFWHSQTPVMLLGRRLPLHIILFYPSIMYNASIAAAKAKLPTWAEPFAVGLLAVLIDIPFDIISVHFLHWVWHDTDPNIADRNYWVPWNSYYFHATFTAGFAFFFHWTRRVFVKENYGKWIAGDSVFKEIVCSTIAGVLGPISGSLAFVLIYHPLHDLYDIHAEVAFTVLLAIFLLIVWSADRRQAKSGLQKPHWTTIILLIHLVLHFAVFLILPIVFDPEKVVAIGLKETIGPCDEYVDLHTLFGMVLKKRKYLCATDYDEKYFDFHCLPNGKAPSAGSRWYTTCGVALPNRVELVVISALVYLVGAVVFGNLHFGSYGDDVFDGQTQKEHAQKKKVKRN